MRLQFDTYDDDEQDAFDEVREMLLEEMTEWASERFPDDAHVDLAAYAETFLNWKYGYGDGDLASVSRHDAAEFLLEWCPRKVSTPPEDARRFAAGLSGYVEFMAATGRLTGGAARAAEVMVYVDEIEDAAVASMGDTSKFGMAKSMFAAPLQGPDGAALADLLSLADGSLSEAELQELLNQRMEAFNALPFEQRKSLTDGRMFPQPPRVELPFVYAAPAPADVAASIAASPLVRMVFGLRDWLGPKGRTITQSGNFRLADARHLVTLLDTGDHIDHDSLGFPRKLRSSRELRWLSLVADVAEEAGAIALTATKMLPVAEWTDLAAVDQAAALVETLVDIGPLSSRALARMGLFDDLDALLDDGVPHWLAPTLHGDVVFDVDHVVEVAQATSREEFPGWPARWGESMWDGIVARDVHEIFDVLVFAGVVTVSGRETSTDRFGGTVPSGGEFSMTPMGRVTMAPLIRTAGYDFDELPDLGSASAAVLVAAFGSGSLDESAIVNDWQPLVPLHERLHAIAAIAGNANESTERLSAMHLLSMLGDTHGPAAVGAVMRELLDTNASGHAALYLLEHELASPDEVGSFVTVAPLVDLLASLLDEPDLLAEMFSTAQEFAVEDILADMWRHDQPETIMVLEALGKHLPDKHLAKTARKAAIRHRSYVANLHH